MPLVPPEHHFPHSLLPLSPGILSHTFSQNPTNPTIAGVSGIGKAFVVVGLSANLRNPTQIIGSRTA
jgi:hypothetical protein